MNLAKAEAKTVDQQPTITVQWLGEEISLNLPMPTSAQIWQGPAGMSGPQIQDVMESLVAGSRGHGQVSVSQLLAGDDRIAIPLAGDAARLALILEPLLQQLIKAGAMPENISLVTDELQFPAIHEKFASQGCQIVKHEPSNDAEKAYLASTQTGTRLYLNKHLLDCDVTLPVIIAEPRGAAPRRGYLQGLWPNFSDTETITKIDQRWRQERNKIRQEIQEVLWLGGFHLAVAAVASGQGIHEIVMENPQQLHKMLMPIVRQAWNLDAEAVELTRNFCLLPGFDLAARQVTLNQLKPMFLTALKLPRADRLVFAFELGEDALGELRAEQEEPGLNGRTTAYEVIKLMQKLGERFKVYSLTNLPVEMTDQAEWIALEEPKELENLVKRNNGWIIAQDADRVRVV